HDPRNTCLQPPTTAGNMHKTAGNLPPLQTRGIGISVLDFKPLDHSDRHLKCAACGRRSAEYIEKVTPTRTARKDKTAIRICKRCFEAAKRRERTKAPPLPGIIVLSQMVRISKDIGRCSVCNFEKAVFHDREAGTRLCQQCHDREALAVGSANGGAGQ
ncbi:MAG: hypothetical protein WCK53_14280, partial [Methanomicrobiales archaeon]